MTRISSYIIDQNIVGNDKWIGSDAQNNLRTKNFTPNNLADYFNGNNVIDIGTSIRYRYQTLDVGEDREQGTISFETEVGPQVNFSDITTFLIAKNTLKGNTVTEYLDFLVDGKVILSKSSNINTFGYYKVTSIEPWIVDPNFFVVVVEFLDGNGFIYEDLDYLVSLVDKVSELPPVVTPTLQDVVEEGRTFVETDTSTDYSFEMFGGIGALKRLYASIVNAGNTSIFSFIRNAFTLKTFSSTNNSSEIATSGSGVTLRHTSSVNTQTLRVVQSPTASASTEFRTPAISDSSTYSLAVMPRVTTSDITASAGVEYNASSISNITFTDPSTGAVSFLEVGYRVFAFRGTVTVGGIIYPQGTYLLRQRNSSTELWQTTILNGGSQDLQSVTDEGNTTSNEIISETVVSGPDGNFYAKLKPNGTVEVYSPDNLNLVNFNPDNITRNGIIYEYPNTATSRIATLLDIPSLTGYVPYTGATADVNLGEFGLLTGNIEFDNTPTDLPTAAGSMYYNDSDGTVDLILKGGSVKLQIGQESVIRVVNKTATNVNLLEANYQAVRVTGAQGQRLKVDLAQATTDNLSAETIGLVTETINNNQEGFITTSGLVRNINTTGSLQGETWADGDILYLSPTTAGMITKVKPVAPNHLVIIGYVVHAHITQGSIFVKVDNGYELDELHNVKITTPLNNEGLIYNSTLEVWENKAINLQRVLEAGGTSNNGEILLSYTGSDYRMFINGDQLLSYDITTNESISIIPPFITVNGTSNNLLIKPSKFEFLQGAFKTEITRVTPTANRVITFKDESGTVALTSDVENTQTNYTNNFLLGGM